MNLELSKTTVQGIKALICIGKRGNGRPVSGRALADEQGIGYDTMLRSLRLLDHARLVRAHRGTSGGYEFSRDPKSITILEVIEAIEGKFTTEPHIEDRFSKSGSNGRLKKAFQTAIKSCLQILDSHSISHLIDGEVSSGSDLKKEDVGAVSSHDSGGPTDST